MPVETSRQHQRSGRHPSAHCKVHCSAASCNSNNFFSADYWEHGGCVNAPWMFASKPVSCACIRQEKQYAPVSGPASSARPHLGR